MAHVRQTIRQHLRFIFKWSWHTWGLMSMEMRGRVVWMCRARVFKNHGEYDAVKGFEVPRLGDTLTAIFDPSAETETGFLSCFAEPQEVADLRYLGIIPPGGGRQSTEWVRRRGRHSTSSDLRRLRTTCGRPYQMCRRSDFFSHSRQNR